MKTLLMAAATSLLTSTTLGQSAAAPHDSVAVFPGDDLQQQIAQLVAEAKEKGSSGATLADYGSYKIQLSVRTKSGGAEVHAHWDDVMMVKEGHATLITGGVVIGGESKPGGETLGTGLEGGQSHALAPGDVFTIRAGTPHQTVVAPGTVYAAVVIKVREP